MNTNKFFNHLFAIFTFTILFTGCVQDDDWETPQVICESKFPAPNITMVDFVALAPSTGSVLLDQDYLFDGYVVSSDENGNFFKTISFQDSPSNPQVGLQVEIDKSANYSDFPIGSHIRISAKGLRLGTDKGIIKIGSNDKNFPIGRIPSSLISRFLSGVCIGNGLDVQKIIPLQLPSLSEAKQQKYVNMLVTVPNVQFGILELGKTYLDFQSGAGVDTDRKIEDNTGSTSILRNAGFVTFGNELLPKGNGALIFVVSKFNNSYQMLIRGLFDVQIPESGLRFDASAPKGGSAIAYNGSFTEDFQSYTGTDLEIFPKYINDPFTGDRYWQLKSFSSNKYIQLSAFNAGGNMKTYFAVPVDFTAANTIHFKTKYGYYNGQPLKVYTTTNYIPLGDFSSATLTDITNNFVFSTSSPTEFAASYTDSNIYNFPAALTGNGFIIFEYDGSVITSTVQLDDIVVN